MPATKGWLDPCVKELFWAIVKKHPEAYHRLFFELRPDGFAYTFLRAVSPIAVLKILNADFFSDTNIPRDSWIPVIRESSHENWREFEEGCPIFSGDFGWRYRESILLEPLFAESRAPTA